VFIIIYTIEFNSLSLPKELISNTIYLVHLQSSLLIAASERDFSFNISSDYKLNYIRYPQSYRTTLVQVSSDMHRSFSNIYSTMYRIQLAVKRIPDHMKTIIRLINAGSPTMIKRMLPTSFNNIAQISHDNEVFINNIIDQFTNLSNFVNEIQQLPIDSSLKFYNYHSDKTDLILYNRFDPKNTLEKVGMTIQQIKNQFELIAELIINLNIKTKLNLSVNKDMIHFISVLYNIENHAYFLYELSSIYTDVLSRYVLDQTAITGRYVTLTSDEERSASISNLSKQLSNALHEIEQIFIVRQNEFATNNIMLQQAYEKLFDEFQHRSSVLELLEIK
jgi:hypothetical protein